MYSYPPYSLYVYSKLCLGISYQVSVFELKFIVEHYFKELPKETYEKKRKVMQWIMGVWRFILAMCFFTDLWFNYLSYFYDDDPDSQIARGPYRISYTVTGTMFFVLAFLLVS